MEKNFNTVRDAFGWWLTHEYPNLPPDVKKGKLTYAWRDFTHGGAISDKRMIQILQKHGYSITSIVLLKSI